MRHIVDFLAYVEQGFDVRLRTGRAGREERAPAKSHADSSTEGASSPQTLVIGRVHESISMPSVESGGAPGKFPQKRRRLSENEHHTTKRLRRMTHS